MSEEIITEEEQKLIDQLRWCLTADGWTGATLDDDELAILIALIDKLREKAGV
jgi:hypothetical protein